MSQRSQSVKVWIYDEADPELQSKILEKLRNFEYENSGDHYAQDMGILYDTKIDPNFAGHEIFKNVFPKYWNLDQNSYIQFDLEFIDAEAKQKLIEYLGLSKELLNKVSFDFQNHNETNTQIQFYDVYESEISLSPDSASWDEHENNSLMEFDNETRPTFNEVLLMLHAFDKFADLMDEALIHLRNNYEYQFTDEALIELAQSNDYEFDLCGDIFTQCRTAEKQKLSIFGLIFQKLKELVN